MSIDERASLRSILAALSVEGVKTADVAKQIPGISEKPFRKALKAAGYTFQNAGQKGWFFTGEGIEPLDQSIFDYVSPSPVSKKETSSQNKRVISSYPKVNSPNIHESFTQDEIRMIREMLVSWKETSTSTQVQQNLYEGVPPTF